MFWRPNCRELALDLLWLRHSAVLKNSHILVIQFPLAIFARIFENLLVSGLWDVNKLMKMLKNRKLYTYWLTLLCTTTTTQIQPTRQSQTAQNLSSSSWECIRVTRHKHRKVKLKNKPRMVNLLTLNGWVLKVLLNNFSDTVYGKMRKRGKGVQTSQRAKKSMGQVKNSITVKKFQGCAPREIATLIKRKILEMGSWNDFDQHAKWPFWT